MASVRLAKVMTQTAIFMPFEDTRKLIKEFTGLKLSVTFIENNVVRIGDSLYRKAEEKGKRPYTIRKKQQGIQTMYIGVDGAMVPLISNEKSVEYKENKLGIVFTDKDITYKKGKKDKDPTAHIDKKHFVSSIAEGIEPFKKMLFAAAVEKGYYTAKEIILLGDGASWIDKLSQEYFPKAVRILDWYHAVEHLWDTAYLLFGEENKSEATAWVKPYETMLWNGKANEVISLIETEAFKWKKKQQTLFDLRGYYVSNKDCMKYNEYRDKGWYIASGFVESANKYIIARRMKQSGMKWQQYQANALIWARCKYYENEWDQFWDSISLPEYLNLLAA
jgi:hypothetical protein